MTSANNLLVQLQVTAATGLPPQAGDTFNISLISANGNTNFFDSNFNTIAYTSTDGTVTIQANNGAATPEPGSLAIGGLAALGFALASWRRRCRRVEPPARS